MRKKKKANPQKPNSANHSNQHKIINIDQIQHKPNTANHSNTTKLSISIKFRTNPVHKKGERERVTVQKGLKSNERMNQSEWGLQ